MRLEKDPTSTNGRFVNPDWEAGKPGTFAVIIGISEYPHLAGGADPAYQTYGLDQLYVSALTAFDVFQWLSEEDDSLTVPAQCWLLLSPTAAEAQANAAVGRLGALATFDNCRRALRECVAAMKRLPAEHAATSRSFFFFSGHGIEVHQYQQVLLPSDYLEPVHGSFNDAISTANLVAGMAWLDVPRHSFFVDACRSDVQGLRDHRLEGTRILDEPVSRLTNTQTVAPVLFAAAAGDLAYQHRNTGQRSIYGTALLEGLRGKQGIELACRETKCDVRLFRLQEMMKRRVDALVHSASNGTQRQRVLFGGGYIDDMTVTRVDVPGPRLAPPPPAPPRPPQLLADSVGIGPLFSPHDVISKRACWDLASGDFSEGHELFQSEHLTELFLTTARLMPLGGGEPRTLPDAEAQVVATTRSEDTRNVAVALRLPAIERGWWLTLPSGGERDAWTVALPGDLTDVTYALDLGTTRGDVGAIRLIQRLDAALALDNSDHLGQVAAAWWAYDLEGTEQAAADIDETGLLEVLVDKVRSPLAASIAAHLLLEIRSRQVPLGWLANLTEWFDLPDPPVLLAEQAAREGDDQTWLHALQLVTERGMPYLAGNLARLSLHVAELRRLNPPGAREIIPALETQLAESLARLSPGGLFVTYLGTPQNLPMPERLPLTEEA